MVWFSYHGGHSGEFCGHAKDTLEQIVQRAIEAGFTHYGLSEHSPRYETTRLFPENPRESPRIPEEREWGVQGLVDRFEAYATEARRLKRVYSDRIELVLGFETEKLPDADWATVMRELRARHGFEYMVGSVHHLDRGWVDFSAEETRQLADECGGAIPMHQRYFDSVRELVTTLRPEVVGHLDLIRKFDGMNARFEDALWPHIDAALEAVYAVDGRLGVNCGAYRRGLSPVYPLPEILARAREIGVRVTLGDDGHGIETVGAGLQASLQTIAKAGYREVDDLAFDPGEARLRWHVAPIDAVRPSSR